MATDKTWYTVCGGVNCSDGDSVLRVCIGIACILIFLTPLTAQSTMNGSLNHVEENEGETEKETENINVDMQVVYGRQYNNILSTMNLSHEKEDFVYLLSSSFKRSHDFGYNKRVFENTSFYENNLGFTGSANVTENWKIIPDVEIDNNSRGMFDNDLYSREEMDKAKLTIKNIFKFTSSFEGYLTAGGASYVHRLRSRDDDDDRSKVNYVSLETGGELIWSASNRIRFIGSMTQNDYSPHTYERDRFWNSELIDDFNITRNFGVSVGGNCDYNNDDGWLLSPIVAFSLKGYKYISVVCLYRYDLVPFKPEEFYLTRKFINPAYDLPPARVHHGEFKADLRLNSIIKIRGSFTATKNNNFYNYTVVEGNVLGAETIPVKSYITRGDANVVLYKTILVFIFSYEYSYYDTESTVTYRPEQSFSNAIKFNGESWKIEWSNKYIDQVYADTDRERRLSEVLIGYFDIQRKMLDSFYAYVRIENLYNNEYYFRDGYPEPGIIVLGGLRIII